MSIEHKIFEILKTKFGYTEFKEGQLESIQSILNQKNTLSILPTGGGKSLIYQLISYTLEGVVLVVSPLISLMKDQGMNLDSYQIPYSIYNSSIDELEQLKSISRAVNNKIQLLYLSPERATTSYFINMSKKMKLACIVIDEAHCISQWGQDFRTEYKELHLLLEHHKTTPVLALTATAGDRVIKDIQSGLKTSDFNIVKKSYYRKNLEFSVQPVDSDKDKTDYILKYLEKKQQIGKIIIYCATRKATLEVYKEVYKKYKSIGIYHAGLSTDERDSIQNKFKENQIDILVATNAFGMGIDLPDIYTIIHYQIPSSIENYYQECGRAGRDGKPSKCILLYRPADERIQKLLLSKKKNKELFLESIKKYVYTKQCRSQFLCNYFGESVQACKKCDFCTGTIDVQKYSSIEKSKQKKEDAKTKAQNYILEPSKEELLISIVQEYSGKFGISTLVSVLKAAKNPSIKKYKLEHSKYYGLLADVPTIVLKEKYASLIEQGRVKVIGKKYPKLSSFQKQIIRNKKEPSVLSLEQRVFKELNYFRNKLASETKLKKFMILTNSTLQELSKKKPQTSAELLKIKGIGSIKQEKYGKQIIEIIQRMIKSV